MLSPALLCLAGSLLRLARYVFVCPSEHAKKDHHIGFSMHALMCVVHIDFTVYSFRFNLLAHSESVCMPRFCVCAI